MKRWLMLVMVLASLPGGILAQTTGKTETKGREAEVSVRAEEAIRKLVEGNRRSTRHHRVHPHESVQRRVKLAREGQRPLAMILSCSDSRVPPEIVFDEGLGDLFVIRNAGHIVDDAVLGSIEYAAEHLGVKLLVVLGHEQCGAVRAAIENHCSAHLRNVIDLIRPTVEAVEASQPADLPLAQLADLVLREYLARSVRELEANPPVIEKLVAARELQIVAGIYQIATGRVEFLPRPRVLVDR
jgi:carbonic anhydrase